MVREGGRTHQTKEKTQTTMSKENLLATLTKEVMQQNTTQIDEHMMSAVVWVQYYNRTVIK